MNIKTITNQYFLKKLICKIEITKNDSYINTINTKNIMEAKRDAKLDAINSLIKLDYSLKDCLKILDNYWPKRYIQLKKQFGIDKHVKHYLKICTDDITYRKILIDRQILAANYLQQQLIESGHM